MMDKVTGYVTDDDERNIHNAKATCSCCAQCGRKLAPDAPVWRTRVRLDPALLTAKGAARITLAPVCERCKPRWGLLFEPAQPCVTRGRPVHNEEKPNPLARKWIAICCEACTPAARATAARQRRSDERGTRLCETCGEVFEPARNDARFCSSPCRQRAYRKRLPLRMLEG